ncbi:MAG: carbon-nitrogen hydrolase family protein, partial [Candidatus Thermoplasmatota archaeon]|nr:carbon-nitrogen hydrolase family protein [Candidatus Thermoplasmatota archaeon]
PLADEKMEGKIYNAAVLVHPDGRIDHYEKMHLPTFGPFEEKWYFASGDKLPIFETKFGKIGLQICYDLFFPEITKAYALQGADIVFCISASPSTTRKFFELILPARAIENTVFMVYSNLVGPQDKLVFWGGGCAIDPRGNVLAKGKYFEDDICIAEVDLGMMRNYRRNRPTIADSKMENYLKIYDILRQLKAQW